MLSEILVHESTCGFEDFHNILLYVSVAYGVPELGNLIESAVVWT